MRAIVEFALTQKLTKFGETVVERDPQVIVIVDYSEITAEQKIQFLLSNPALQSVDAIRNKRFIVIPYVAATPGIENIDAIETLAAGFHGQALPGKTQ